MGDSVEKPITIAMWVVTLLFGVARCFLPKGNLHLTNGFAAAAHLYVGGLIGGFVPTKNWHLLIAAILLSVVEVAMFFLK